MDRGLAVCLSPPTLGGPMCPSVLASKAPLEGTLGIASALKGNSRRPTGLTHPTDLTKPKSMGKHIFFATKGRSSDE